MEVRPEGIYYLPCQRGAKRELDQAIHLYDPATGEDREFGRLEGYHRPRDFYTATFRALAVSPDGGAILYTRRIAEGADLMLIRNFR